MKRKRKLKVRIKHVLLDTAVAGCFIGLLIGAHFLVGLLAAALGA